MPRINTYTDNTSIENDDKLLTYDTQGAATKLTAFSTIWTWITRKLHALTSSSASLTPSTDRVIMDKNGTMTRVEPSAVAKYAIEDYAGSTIAGVAQSPKAAIDALNSKMSITLNRADASVSMTDLIDANLDSIPYGCSMLRLGVGTTWIGTCIKADNNNIALLVFTYGGSNMTLYKKNAGTWSSTTYTGT